VVVIPTNEALASAGKIRSTKSNRNFRTKPHRNKNCHPELEWHSAYFNFMKVFLILILHRSDTAIGHRLTRGGILLL
jgi:hypothetical protein